MNIKALLSVIIVSCFCFMELGSASQDAVSSRAENFIGFKTSYPSTAFAMTKEYTLLAEEREMPYPTWMPESHNIFLCSNDENTKELIATIDEPWVYVLTDGSVFYVLSAGYFAFTEVEHSIFTIQCYDPVTMEYLWEHRQEIEDENGYVRVKDAVVLDGCLYLITGDKILSFDPDQLTLCEAFNSLHELTNTIYSRHVCIYGDELILTNNSGEIIAFDTKTHQVRKLSTTISNRNAGTSECIFSYYVYKDKLIYNLASTESMYSYDMQTEDVEFFIHGRCGIACETPNGLYLEYADGGYTKYFLETSTMEETRISDYEIDVIGVWKEILK